MKNMKNLTSYLLTVALLVSPALLAQAAEQQGTEGQQTENAQPNQPPQDQTQNEERAPAPPQATPPSSGHEGGNQSEGTTSPNEPTGQPSEQSVGGEKFIEQESGQQLLASKLIGSSVTNLQNENLGHVEDLILNQNGQATGLVISVGGFLGLGAKHVAIPLSEAQINGENRSVKVSISKKELDQAPAFKTRQQQQNERKENTGQKEGSPGSTNGQ